MLHSAIDIFVAQCYNSKRKEEDMINSNKIKGRMAELGFTQKDIAERLNIAPPTVSQKINNIRPMDLDEAEALARMLNIEAGEFGKYFFSETVA